MSSYDGDSPTIEAASGVLDAARAHGNASDDGGLGDGGAFGKYCTLDGTFTRACQYCRGFACSFFR